MLNVEARVKIDFWADGGASGDVVQSYTSQARQVDRGVLAESYGRLFGHFRHMILNYLFIISGIIYLGSRRKKVFPFPATACPGRLSQSYPLSYSTSSSISSHLPISPSTGRSTLHKLHYRTNPVHILIFDISIYC